MTDSLSSINSLEKYLEVSRSKYDAFIDAIDHDLDIPDIDATLRFKHLRFDMNGQPKFRDLAFCLADYIIEYSFSARKRGTPQTPNEWSRLNRQARSLLRKLNNSGESGEILLYFLLEAVLRAPQMVAKIDLKTNPNMEVHGSDGIHMRWNQTDSCLDIYFGEAKLEQTVYNALTHAFDSLDKFHTDKLLDHEYGLVTSHYKWADDRTKQEVLNFVDRQEPGADCRINHACLMGYNWGKYRELDGSGRGKFISEFSEIYKADAPRLRNLLASRFSGFKHTQFRFEIFFLPFKSVEEFRAAFNEAVS